MEQQKRILFLYEHIEESARYVRALRDLGFDVQRMTSVDRALDLLEERCLYDLIIWTMWLHPGKRIGAYRVELHGGGTKTGACFVKLVRAKHPTVTMLLFSINRVLVREYSRPEDDHYAWCFTRSTPERFAQEVSRLLRSATKSTGGTSHGT